ncbi:MAG: glycosyl transferase, partial [Lachnospiraceae bacterium]|nr:glycosyl transferase [Lachnospiraceae bacterium]
GVCDIILMSRTAKLAGVNFKDIYNVSFVGESAHFAIRAAVLGFQIYIDTCCPAYHIFDEQQLENVGSYKKQVINYEGLNHVF